MAKRNTFLRHFLLAAVAFLMASVAVLFIVVSLKMESSPVYGFVERLRGAADEQTEYDVPDVMFDEEEKVMIEVRSSGMGYANKGDIDVVLMRIDLAVKDKSNLMEMEVRADSHDFKALNLYFDEQLVASVPVYQGRAVFSDLWIDLLAGVKNELVIKGEVATTAKAGDVISIFIAESSDISITGDLSDQLEKDVQFPIRGRNLRVIGEKIL